MNWFVGATWDEEDGRVADDRFEQGAIQANLGARPSAMAELRLTGRYASWEIDDYRDASGGPVYGDGRLRTEEHEELSLGADVWLGRGAKRHLLRATLFRQVVDRSSPAIGPAVPRSVEHTEFTNVLLGWDLPVVLNERDRVTVGTQLRVEDGRNDSTLFLPFGVDGSYELERETPGVYMEWLGRRGPVLIEIGGRIDVPEDDDTQISPRFGILWRLSDGATRLRASLSRGFKLPSFAALGSPPQLGGNPDLEPEISYGADLGLSHRFARAGVDASITLFHNDYDDLIDFDFATFSFQNLDDVRARGVEGAANWFSPKAFEIRLNATWQDVENRETGEPLRHRPEWVVGGRFIWRLAGKFRWQVDGQWQSDMRDEQIPVPDRTTVPSWSAFGASFYASLTRSWDVRVRVDNLFDREYETLIGFPAAGRTARVDFRCQARSLAE